MGLRRKHLVLLVSLLSTLLAFVAHAEKHAAKSATFPERSRAVSPNGRYATVGVDSDAEPHHTVFLEDRKLKTRRKLFTYERSIDLLWNPDSKSFALTDYGGSDFSLCSIISIYEKVPSVDILEKVVKAVSAKERKTLLENHHVYIVATEWFDSDRLRVKVWGYGEVNPSGFTRFYIFDIHRGISRDKR
jgi:hypothetical protein